MIRKRTDQTVVVRRLSETPLLESALAAVAARPRPFILESTAPNHPNGRFTILGFDPVETIRIETASSGWIDDVQHELPCGGLWPGDLPVPFAGGWVGYIAYEAGPVLERVNCRAPRDIALPHVCFSLYDTVAVHDHGENAWYATGTDGLPTAERRPAVDRRLDELEATLCGAEPVPPIDWAKPAAGQPLPMMTRPEYLDRVQAAKRYIEAGDIYQVNLTQRFTARCHASPWEVFRRLRVSNPAPLSALLIYGDSAVISASPELFLSLRDRHIVTRPIKGTRPRTGDEVLDAIRSRELLASEKDRAELTMIVDLLRNDLGRVSDFGSVRVIALAELEAHPTVFHLVATIEGRLRRDCTWADLLRAAFPGGSITGAPKIRATQIIDELEPTERSVYCGAIGYIGLDGSVALNIAIRTMILDRGRIHLFGGGAIVADSDPQDEYAETIAKTAGLVSALGAHETRMPLETGAEEDAG